MAPSGNELQATFVCKDIPIKQVSATTTVTQNTTDGKNTNNAGTSNTTGKDEQVVEYAMSRSMSPTMVSQYTLKLIDKKLLEEKLKEINDIVEENNNKE